MRIEIGTFEGCPNASPTVELLKRILTEEGVSSPVDVVHIEDSSAAEAFRFLGSPTVKINGIDVEPARRTDTAYALTCRVYRTGAGNGGVPPKEMISSAVRDALVEEGAAPKTVLFVCGHSAGRSQMARDRGLAVRAESAGTGPADRINPAAVMAMEEIGFSLDGQHPKVMTVEMVNRAHNVITMGCGVDVAACPAKFLVTEDWGLDEPAGQPVETVRHIRDEIRERVEALLDEMTSGPESVASKGERQ